jgi:hypothetical protein
MAQVRVTVDGVNYADDVEPRMLLVYYLRSAWGRPGRSSAATPATAVPARCTSTGRA